MRRGPRAVARGAAFWLIWIFWAAHRSITPQTNTSDYTKKSHVYHPPANNKDYKGNIITIFFAHKKNIYGKYRMYIYTYICMYSICIHKYISENISRTHILHNLLWVLGAVRGCFSAVLFRSYIYFTWIFQNIIIHQSEVHFSIPIFRVDSESDAENKRLGLSTGGFIGFLFNVSSHFPWIFHIFQRIGEI